jgi:hypothetical protein
MFTICTTLSAQDLANLNNTKPVTLHGSLGANLIFYGANGIKARQDPFSYGFNANATLSLYGISMPFSFIWYNNNKSNFNQPFNQFGISPTYKWITCHLGYRSLNFSEFTLSGQTFLGAGVEMNPGKLRIGAVYGKFNRNSDYDPYAADSLPKFSRLGWALKLGYGTANNFVDFSMLRIGDHTKHYISPNDSLVVPTPEQNMVYGLNSKLALIKNLSFEVDGSISFYTDDRKAQSFDSINDKWLKLADNFMTINQTSSHYTAFKSALVYKFTKSISVGLEYKRIAPGYRSMGAYFFNNDVENITINPSLILLNNKLNTKGSLGLQHDNLDNSKKSTSHRTVGSLLVSYNINQHFGIDGNYSNFTTNQKAGRMPIVDTLKLYQINQTYAITPRIIYVTANLSHVVMLNYNFMKLDDKNKKTQNQTQTNTTVLFLNYMLGFVPQKMNLTIGINYTGLKNNLYKNTMEGLTAGLAKTLFDNNLSVSWNNSYLFNKVNADRGTIFNSSLSVNYRFAKKHALTLNMYYIKNSFGEKSATPSFNEYRGDFSYVFTF